MQTQPEHESVPRERVRTAVIGYGYAGRSFHSYLIGLVPQLELRGIASRDEATRTKIAAERRCIAYESFEQVLDDPLVDLVVLATPNSTHAELTIRALNAGKHVVTDKVMCLTLADCDAMIDAARRSRRMLNVFHNARWNGDFLTVRQLIDAGSMGRLRIAEIAWQGWGMWGGWRGRSEMGGGKFFDLGAHIVDQLLLLFPQAIQSVYCRMHYDAPGISPGKAPGTDDGLASGIDTESQSTIIIGFADGATATCDTSSLAAITKPKMFLCGTGGTFIKSGFEPQEAAMVKGDIDASREDPAKDGQFSDGKTTRTVPTIAGRWRNYYENIAAVLLRGDEPAVKLSEMRRVIGVLDAARRSAKSGDVVRVTLPAL